VTRLQHILRFACSLALFAGPLAAQADPSLLSVRSIYASPDFAGERFGPTRWLENGAAYTTLEKSEQGKGRDIVRYATVAATRTVLVPASAITPPGDTTALDVEDYSWSPDGSKLLIFTNSQPVWRQNNRGDYWMLDRASGKLQKLGGPEAKPSTLLFAKFSPDGSRIGYVRENNIYVEDLATGTVTQVTTDGAKMLINGTFDWVYEEELNLRDGWRWSPDGQRIAYWQLNTDGVLSFDLINDTDSLYSFVTPVQYPKAGESNSAARVGVVSAAGGTTVWLPFDGDPREYYPARMEWAGNSTELVVQRLNRLQNTLELFLADATTGQLRTILTEHNSTWVNVVDDVTWLNKGQSFTWLSERDGWNHLYLVSRNGQTVKLLTPGAFDVLDVVAIDDKAGWAYYLASPDTPTQRYLWRVRTDGKGKAERVTPASLSGVNVYNMSPDAAHAWHTYSNISTPPTIDLVSLPGHASVRTVVTNEKLKAKLAVLKRGSTEFVKVPIDSGIVLNGYVMKPADFDSSKKYPILFQVYGGPGSQTVVDSWQGAQYLWHTMLTQQGYLVASVDNRGTGARGKAWRDVIYGQLGVVETKDQAAAARTMGRWSYVDSTRIGIWGWSYGGFMSLNALFQHPEVYRTAVAVAPVTHWKYYDNIYTERYNGLPKDNQKGYDAGSPLSHVDGLKGNLLVIHGSGDDNVHYQNTEALVNKLVAANKQFSMMEYPNRNHGIFGGNTRQHLFDLMTRYLQENLLAPTAKNYTF
jgi:dipeptidyl-peptidase-4